jgi:hypothetical protein
MSETRRNPLGLLCDFITPRLPLPLVRRFLDGFNRSLELRNWSGYHVRPYHFACPIADPNEIDPGKLKSRGALGDTLLDYGKIEPLVKAIQPYAKEIHHFPVEPDGKSPYWFNNYAYDAYDATILHGLIRHLKPKRIVEAGSGFSSMVMTTAANMNAEEGCAPDITHIEPYPPERLLNYPLAGKLLKEKIEDLDLGFFRNFEANDILFIDSTHVLKTQSDLVYIFNYILPLLPSGVYVHFHDVFTPYDADEHMLFEMQWSWNEQYALEAILLNSNRFEVAVPSFALVKERPELMKQFVPWETAIPKGFWIRTC